MITEYFVWRINIIDIDELANKARNGDANAKFSLPENMSITNMYLEDEKGNKYNRRGGTSYSTDNFYVSCPDFESPYFDKIEKLYLVFDTTENGKNKSFKIELKKQ
ncbi:hypothetical protein [Clostridium sp. OS1-26]|uniref:hypothetical protein n=1 Tax=Clostridium sp. OS1-26 TaxID=3070681 RepID=UPI0027E1F143|nr:hypothetical protein [Clostridium sp. OS1-26]WML34253.1 hypothetical protein RCG18_23635 [Clostridium sp. OS1-26]